VSKFPFTSLKEGQKKAILVLTLNNMVLVYMTENFFFVSTKKEQK
jgi:hypothetical protein